MRIFQLVYFDIFPYMYQFFWPTKTLHTQIAESFPEHTQSKRIRELFYVKIFVLSGKDGIGNGGRICYIQCIGILEDF